MGRIRLIQCACPCRPHLSAAHGRNRLVFLAARLGDAAAASVGHLTGSRINRIRITTNPESFTNGDLYSSLINAFRAEPISTDDRRYPDARVELSAGWFH